MSKQNGFTLLELLIAIAIIGVLSLISVQTGIGNWGTKREGRNTLTTMIMELETLKGQANLRNTTTRGVLTNSGQTYTFTTLEADVPTTNCSTAGATWTQISAKSFDIGDQYEIDGTATDNICFNRDGSSSGGTFIISPIDASSTQTTFTVTITISTGFLDVIES